MRWKLNFPLNGSFLLALGLSALLLLILKTMPVTAEEPERPETIPVSSADLASEGPQTGLPEMDILLDGKRYRAEVVITAEQAQKGLMYRTELAENRGMLFPFNPPRAVNFWMKNMKIPLDMLFLRDGRVINLIENVPPCKASPCPTYGSVYPVDTVLELPAGTAEKAGIRIGDTAAIVQPSVRIEPQAER